MGLINIHKNNKRTSKKILDLKKGDEVYIYSIKSKTYEKWTIEHVLEHLGLWDDTLLVLNQTGLSASYISDSFYYHPKKIKNEYYVRGAGGFKYGENANYVLFTNLSDLEELKNTNWK